MSSYGFKSDHINLIADNLRDRYKSGFPILKELIQNADDAKARRLVFGMHPGFKDRASHPLLQGPGLWTFNNGLFKKEDERAIRSFGLNSKAGESGSIGKFGLGMKSVFHLCEAFFYVAYDGQKHFDVLLNPWRDPDGGDLFHGAWDNDEALNYECLRSVVQDERLSKGCKTWFFMWIPLRSRDHVPQKDGKPYGGIVDKYPGDGASNEAQSLFEGGLSHKIQSIVPLLRSLESVEFAGSAQIAAFKIAISFDAGGQRVDHASTELVSTGSVSGAGGGKEKLCFRVQQKALAGQIPFSQFQKLDVWPKTGRLNSDGVREPVPDESEAEGAVLVSAMGANGVEARLDIDWAVFLPMEDGLSYQWTIPKGRQHYRIVLHGQFFVDAGRRGIAGFSHLAGKPLEPSADLDDADLHTGWNQCIAQQVVLPQLLSTLARFADGLKTEAEKESLALAILSARTGSSNPTGTGRGFWDSFRDFICHEQAWVRLITPEGPKWSHEKLTGASRLLLLPPPPAHDPARPWNVLPGLRQLSDEGCLLIDQEAPSLMRTHSDWDNSTLLGVISAVDMDEACSETGMAYFVRFLSLERCRYVGSGEMQEKLIRVLRTMLRHEQLSVFRRMRSVFQELVSLVKPEHRIAIGTRQSGAVTALDDATLKLLMNADVKKLVLPLDLDPAKEAGSRGLPDANDIQILLKTLDQEISRLIGIDGREAANRIGHLLHAAGLILNQLDDKERGPTARANRSFRVLTATCARNHTGHPVSFDELQKANGQGLLFKSQGIGRSAHSVATELANLLPDERIWVVGAELAGWISDTADPNAMQVSSAVDPSAAYATLGKPGRPFTLAGLRARSDFIQKMSSAVIKSENVVRGMRYVLHGSQLHHKDDTSTLWITAGKTDVIWIKLKRMVQPDSWNVVDSSLAGAIMPNDWDKLGISKVGAAEVIDYMSCGSGVNQIKASEFNENEISEILSSIEDGNLWKAIPIHRDESGSFDAISENCFMDPTLCCPSVFHGDIRIIVRGSDSRVREKQREYVPDWSPSTTIEQALNLRTPEIHWEMILEAAALTDFHLLQKIPLLKSTPWLPLRNNSAISPERVIDLDGLEEDIERLASGQGYEYAGILAIPQKIQDHYGFPQVRQLFEKDKTGLSRLGKLMASAGYFVGCVDPCLRLNDLIEPLAGLDTLPAWVIVKRAVDASGAALFADVNEYLIREIRQAVPTEQLIGVLNEISHKKTIRQREIFNLHLQQLADCGNFSAEMLTKFSLLALDGSWKSASELCSGWQGVVKGNVLDEEQARILGRCLSLGRIKQVQGTLDNSGGAASPSGANNAQIILTNYFKPWRELMSSGPVGAFFALLGLSFRGLAAEWLKPHTSANFYDQLGWNDIHANRSDPAWDYRLPPYGKSDAMKMLEFIPEISGAKEIEVISLTGQPFRVALDAGFDSLVMGRLVYAGKGKVAGTSRFRIALREVTHPEQHDKEALSNMLRKTCECILREAYNQPHPNLGQIWETLGKSNQLELAIARGLILDRLPYDLRNLRTVKKNPDLVSWQSAFKRLETSRAERLEAKQSTDLVEKDISAARTALSVLMTNNPEVQKSVLEGIRQRVMQNQYEVSSIAFEIFQNADDAVTELQILMLGDSAVAHPAAHVGRFVIETSNDTLRFLHWGRPVNYMGHGKSRDESYGEDLQRMLILAASDKDETTGLTGKFGLGFKSTLLATDAPCIMSGDLRTKIVGGCLPMQWRDAAGANDALQRHRLAEAPGLRGTVVEFEVNGAGRIPEVLDRFASLAGIQCIFSKKIRSIQVLEALYQWSPVPMTSLLPGIETGSAMLPSKKGLDASLLVNFRLGDACFLMRLGSRGFVGYQNDVKYSLPGIWVTAPTREAAARGLILNCQFALDTGRGGLPHGDSADYNLDIAERLGDAAANVVLQATLQTRNDWNRVRSMLKLAKGVTASEFWATFWTQIPARELEDDDGEASRLLSRFGLNLLRRFIAIAEEISNGLAGTNSAFVKILGTHLALNSRWEKHYESLRDWPEFVVRYPVSGWVSEPVADRLKMASDGIIEEITEMSVGLLLGFADQNRCGPGLADRFGLLLESTSPDEFEVVTEKIKTFVFMAKDGSWRRGDSLLKAGSRDNSEKLMLIFAPPMCILHSSYTSAGVAMLRAYTDRFFTDSEMIAEWILNLPNDALDGRVAALRYLLGSPVVQMRIRLKISGSWIECLDSATLCLETFSILEKNQLLVMFNPLPVWLTDIDVNPVTPSDLLNRKNALLAIRDWWKKDGTEQLKKFDRNFWPASVPRQFGSAVDDRGSWMTLFAIGLMQRHGRVLDQQNRGFIDHMQGKGFWDVFCHKSPDSDGEAWLDVLRKYGESNIEDETYGMWMDNFPRMYRIANWYDVYVQVFQGLHFRGQSEVSQYISPSADPVMSGSGIQAPTLRKSLKLGQHVVVRELLRWNAIDKSDAAQSLAFKPGYAVRKLLSGIGFDDLGGNDVSSQQIYRVLKESLDDEATFGGAYDIPLVILARDGDLQRQILGNAIFLEDLSDGE